MSRDPSPKSDGLRAMREHDAEEQAKANAKAKAKAKTPKLTKAQLKARERDALDDV